MALDPRISEWGNPIPRRGITTKVGRTQGTETSKYLQEEKTTVIPQVAASERGAAQTGGVTACPGL